MLQDSFGRRFYYLRLSITDVCNFRCTYCLPEGYKGLPEDAFLSAPEISKTVQAFAKLGTEKVRITGGEPSLRKDLPDIISSIKATSGIKKVALTTNGYKLDKNIHDWHRSGLDQLNVSIDSFDKETFKSVTGHDRIDEIMAGIESAISFGIKVKVNAVLMKGMNDNLSPIFAWLKSNPATFRFIEVMETADQDVFFRQYHRSGGAIKQQLLDDNWQSVIQDQAAGPAQEFWHPDYKGRMGLIMPYSKDFCATCNRLRVSSLGKMHLCLFAEQGVDLRPFLAPNIPIETLIDAIQGHVSDKKLGHDLLNHNSGAMQNLSQIGG
ncbi:GTP 3',8-cyclase MoaA [Reinekea forsetii]|nr:GTP 3',8-cyclase MoaA [Reinekea forsetii]